MRTIKALSIAAAAVLAICGNIASASDRAEFEIRSNRMASESERMSPRARGLGGSFAALSNGAAGVYENPAGLGAQTNQQVIMDLGFDGSEHGDVEMSMTEVTIGGAFNINSVAPDRFPRDNMGNHTAGIVYHYRNMDWTNSNKLEADVSGLTVAYGASLRGGQIYWGGSLGIMDGDLVDDNSFDRDWHRWEFKLGGIVRIDRKLAVGGTVALGTGNMDEKRPGDAEGDSWHTNVRFGMSYDFSKDILIVSDLSIRCLELSMEEGPGQIHSHKIWRYSAGVEKIIDPKSFIIRGGAYYSTDEFDGTELDYPDTTESQLGVTGGFTYFKDNFELTYTAEIRSNGDTGSYFNFGYNW